LETAADIDYARLWRDLVERFREEPARSEKRMMARWGKRARSREHTEERRKRDRDDPLMQFVLGRLGPGDTVLDVGAGIGRWSIPMARACKKVTALDKLPGMLEIIRENASREGVENIETIRGDWQEADLEPHDHVLSSHAAYTSPDIVEYARKMESLARKASYLVMRVPKHDGVIGELSRRIHGSWHDSPNFLVGYYALLQAGISGHVILEEAGRHWHDETLEEALDRVKRHLHLQSDEHDGVIMNVLEERLSLRDGEYWWPDWMRSALIWWHSGAA
jgi:2-polyprenyl-3-methyl-5-hydroxy-6-metoxy-1,4-benzoquinol methylase